MTDQPNTFVGIDLSGPQTRCLVAVGDGPRLRYLGCGSMPPVHWAHHEQGDSQMTHESVREAVLEAERSVDLAIVSAVVGIGGSGVRSSLIRSKIWLRKPEAEVTMGDVGRVVQKCANSVADGRSVALQVVPLKFAVGSMGGLRHPLGLRSDRLEAYVRVLSTRRENHERAKNLVNRAGVNVAETVLGGFAAAYGTLGREECDRGVAHLDIGKTATSLTAYCRGALRLARGIPVGRDRIVEDVGRAFGEDYGVGSALVTDFGRVLDDSAKSESYVVVPGGGGGQPGGSARPWPREMLDKIIALRLQECMELARDELRHEGLLAGAVRSLVLTGELAALAGIARLAQAVIGLRTRIGIPAVPEGLPEALRCPAWACPAGLVLYAHRLAYRPDAARRRPCVQKRAFTGKREQEVMA